MLNRRGQLFLILLCIFTIMVLGTALFLLSQKAAEFQGSIGKQQYGALKLFHANNKFFMMYEAQAKVDLENAVQTSLATLHNPCQEMFDTDPFWYIEGRLCAPDLLGDVQSRFNALLTPRFRAMRAPRLLAFKELLGFDWHRSIVADSSEETFALQIWERPLGYTLTPVSEDDISQVIATASARWTLKMQDAQQGYDTIAQVQQYPNFRLEPRFDVMILHRLELLPARLASDCKGRPTPEIRNCVATILESIKQEGIIEHYASASHDRDVKIMLRIQGPLAPVELYFAVGIPAEGLLFVGPLGVFQGETNMSTSFSLEDRDVPLEIRSKVRIPSMSGTTLELCTSPNQEPRIWTCPYKIIDVGQLDQDASQSVIAEDQRSIDVKYFWSAFPQGRFLIKLKATTATGQTHDSQQVISVF